MTKRMTAEEVLADLQDELHHATEWFEASSQPFDQGLASGFAKAVDLVRDNLIPQWQDEPDADGWHWVEGGVQPHRAMQRDDGTWMWFCNGYSVDVCGRCCPIGARPQ